VIWGAPQSTAGVTGSTSPWYVCVCVCVHVRVFMIIVYMYMCVYTFVCDVTDVTMHKINFIINGVRAKRLGTLLKGCMHILDTCYIITTESYNYACLNLV
jgi:hypothetical protein